MDVERLTTIVPVDDLAAAVATWSGLLGVEPTFVDGDRWAQFDVAGSRVALSGADRVGDDPALMLKVGDLAAAREQATGLGLRVGEPQEGPHEVRCLVEGADGMAVVLYAPR